jgi:uncharacterized protein
MFFLMVPLEFASLEWRLTPHGTWLITPAEASSAPLALVMAICSILVLVGSFVFVLCGCLRRFAHEQRLLESTLQARDIAYFTAWVQTFNLFFTLMLLLFPGLGEAMALSLFTPYLPFCWMCLSAAWILKGRWRQIGFVQLDSAFWVKVPLAVIAIYLLFVFVVDRHLTEWFADVCSLELSSWREDSISEGIKRASGLNPLLVVLQLIAIGLIGPMAEEILFRGFLQDWLTKDWGAGVGVMASALLFALFHIDVPLLPTLFLLGMALALLKSWTKNLWAPILFHCFNNTIATLVDMSGSGLVGYF